jgi:hypothetical protein
MFVVRGFSAIQAPDPYSLADRRSWRCVGKSDPVKAFPILGGNHFDSVPRTTIQEGAIRSFADALLATNAEIGINFDAPEGWVIFVGHPEHTRLNGAILDAGR